MNIKQEIQKILLDILRTGLLRIRSFGWEGRADECALEADHLHNLPNLVSDTTLDLVLYYYRVERPSFAQKTLRPQEFEPYWEQLGSLLVPKEIEDVKG